MSERLTPPAAPEGRLTERAFILSLLALVLLTPPIITIFDVPIFVFGIALLQIYCFGIWLAAIVAGGILSARMSRSGPAPDNRPRPIGPRATADQC
jgi:hypothetical protein